MYFRSLKGLKVSVKEEMYSEKEIIALVQNNAKWKIELNTLWAAGKPEFWKDLDQEPQLA